MSDSTKPAFTFTANFNTNAESQGGGLQEQNKAPFCIAMLGNFSAPQLATNKSTDIAERNFIEVDRYNVDEILASMSPNLTLCLNQDVNNKVDVRISCLQDFHPNKLYKKVDTFSQLRDLRTRLNNPATFKQAARELGAFDDSQDAQPEPVSEPTKIDEPEQPSANQASADDSGFSFLDSIVDETEKSSGNTTKTADSPATSVSSPASKSVVGGFIQQLFADKQKIRSRDPRQNEMIATIDEAITLQMQSILHHPEFQALESLWRAVYFVVKRVPKDITLKLFLLDLSQEELASDLEIRDVTQSQLYKLFGDTSMGDINWSLIVGDYRFGPDIDDILSLSQLGFIAQHAGAQFIAAADEKLVGCDSFAQTSDANKWLDKLDPLVEQAWLALRKSEVAKNISLALPRFIIREPYGKNSAPVKSFAFEEMSSPPNHEDYLWGNPAFLKAEQIAKSFLNTGWAMNYSGVLYCEDLPLHYYEDKGRTLIKPCAEIPLSSHGAQKMIAQGLIPLSSVKDTDKVHSGAFHSIAD